MASMRKLILPLCVAVAASFPLKAAFDIDSLPQDLRARLENFFEADTGKARAGMAAFKDDELQKIITVYKKSRPQDEQRILWLVEESYRRNAERVASERIHYLYYAVLAALALIIAFSALTYARARNLNVKNQTSAQHSSYVEPSPSPETVPAKRSKPASKGKRKK